MLKKCVSVFVFILFTLFSVSMVFGKDVPAGKWWYNATVVKNLQLTGAEIRNLDSLYSKSMSRLKSLKDVVTREQAKLERLLERKDISQSTIQKQFDRLENARRDLSRERLNFVVEVRKIIGRQRFQQLKQSYKSWQ